MKKWILGAMLGITTSLFGTDFAVMTTEQLMNSRGKIDVAERAAFKTELQKRVQTMTAEEKAKYNVGQGLGGKPKGGGMGQGKMLQDGSRGGMGGK